MEQEYKYDVFLSFANKDIEFVTPIKEKLKNKGINVFFFKENLRKSIGYSFNDEIGNALEQSRDFILVWTPNAVKSKWVKREYEAFYNQIYMKHNDRRLIILQDEHFDESSIPFLIRDLQKPGSFKDLMNILSRKKALNPGEQEKLVPGKSKDDLKIFWGMKKQYKKVKKTFHRVFLTMLFLALAVSAYLIIEKLVVDRGKLYVTNLSFMDGVTRLPMVDKELRDSIDDAVIKGMNRAKQPLIKNFSFKISRTDKYKEKLKNTIFDPDLTMGEKIKTIIDEVMVPLNLDAVVSVFYICQENRITVRPFIVVKNTRKIATKNLQFSELELFCQDPAKREKILCHSAEKQISAAVQELVRCFNLEAMYIKSFPFLYVKSISFEEKIFYSFMKDREEEELINKAVLQGIYEVQGIKSPNNRLLINAPRHSIRNSEANANKLMNIIYNPGLPENDKIKKIIKEIMEPHGVDIIVTGQYIDKSDAPLITVRPTVVVRDTKEIIFRTIQFEREELRCMDAGGNHKVLSSSASGHIVRAVQEMLEQL